MGRNTFTEEEADVIRELLIKKVISSREDQKRIRRRLRCELEFYISDFTETRGFTVDDFNDLVQSGIITIVQGNNGI